MVKGSRLALFFLSQNYSWHFLMTLFSDRDVELPM